MNNGFNQNGVNNGYDQNPMNNGYNPNGMNNAYNQNPMNNGYNPNGMNFGYVLQMKTNRGLLKYILLSFITFGIYGIVVFSSISSDINILAYRYDGKKTMHFCLMYFVFSWLTFGVVPIVWSHRISARVGDQVRRRNLPYSFGAADFWLWNVLGSLIIVGPFIYLYKFFKSMNMISADFNMRGC